MPRRRCGRERDAGYREGETSASEVPPAVRRRGIAVEEHRAALGLGLKACWSLLLILAGTTITAAEAKAGRVFCFARG
jgi:hypothetical protein